MAQMIQRPCAMTIVARQAQNQAELYRSSGECQLRDQLRHLALVRFRKTYRLDRIRRCIR